MTVLVSVAGGGQVGEVVLWGCSGAASPFLFSRVGSAGGVLSGLHGSGPCSMNGHLQKYHVFLTAPVILPGLCSFKETGSAFIFPKS